MLGTLLASIIIGIVVVIAGSLLQSAVIIAVGALMIFVSLGLLIG